MELKKTKKELGNMNLFVLRIPKYFTSHSNPERLKKYLGLGKDRGKIL